MPPAQDSTIEDEPSSPAPVTDPEPAPTEDDNAAEEDGDDEE